jgi:Ribonuclease G/E
VAAWDGFLVDYAIWRPGAPDGVGDLHRGRVTAVVPAMAGAFVAIGDAAGFLPDSEGAAGVTQGTVLAVRVTRAAHGGKGPRLTARLNEAERRLAGTGPPALLRRGPGALGRLAAMHADAPVVVDDPALAATLRPLLRSRLTVGPTFDDAVEPEIAALSDRQVVLPGGARVTMDPTPALTAIDVDLGAGGVGRGRKAATHAAANRALLPALARQIRLRNLGGAVLIDLAGMTTRRRAALGPDVIAALAPDPLQPRFLGFTALGLAEILRPRIHPPLHELLAGPHAAGLAALRRADAELAAQPARMLALRAAPPVVAALQADPVALGDLARRAGRPLILRSDATLATSDCKLEEISRD